LQSLIILRPGMLTTVQDLGRWGHQGRGVPVAGPMDPYSHVLANRLVGNPPSAASLEITLIGPDMTSNVDVICAIAGADFTVMIDADVAPMHRAFTLKAGARLRFGDRMAGARASLAVRGGIAVEALLGSRSTSLVGRMGPFDGRSLRAGDVLPIGPADGPGVSALGSDIGEAMPLPLPVGGAKLRVVPGPQEHLFASAAYDTLFASRFVVTPASNRMGYRLDGPRLAQAGKSDILSDATPLGAIQVPGSGHPILLMADRQTTGGYPKIATVISADIPIAGQLAPGDWIEFAPCTRDAAVAALKVRYGLLDRLVPWGSSTR
jgi:antagonist of KipI